MTDVKDRKGGRPKLEAARKRTAHLSIRLTEQEHRKLKELADGAHMTVTDFAVARLTERPIFERIDWKNFDAFLSAAADIAKLGGSLREYVTIAKGGMSKNEKSGFEKLIHRIKTTHGEMLKVLAELADRGRRRRRHDHQTKPGILAGR